MNRPTSNLNSMSSNTALSSHGIDDCLLAAAIQLGWLDGLNADEIGKQLQMPRSQVESIIGERRDLGTNLGQKLQMEA
ncbi:MAG: hypothetical protein AAGG48_06345 [Planctomycetota bacterium]